MSRVLGVGVLWFAVVLCAAAQGPHWESVPVASTHRLEVGGATLQVDFGAGSFAVGDDAILKHVQTAASAVAAYYGHFPVASARVLIVPVADRHGVLQGTTWGGVRGWPGFTRMRIGQHTTAQELAQDWMMTHELVHMGFPSLPDENHWMEEGLATYVEPLARVMVGDLRARRVWHDMVRDMHQGEPAEGDEGLDHTHTWGRTYWGGAMFCLVADVEIRRATGNRKGLREALRAVVDAGGTIDHDWPLEKALAIGDGATGTHVLTALYAAWKDKPVHVDLDKLWKELGVRWDAGAVEFDNAAPLANVRQAIAGEKPF